MNFSFFIAARYFFTKRKRKFINVISLLSTIAVAFATAALIIVLSVFNGLEALMHSIYTTVDPSIKIEATTGKSFEVTDTLLNSIQATAGVQTVTEVIEDYVYLRYHGADMVVTMKGVSENFTEQQRFEGYISGDFMLQNDSTQFALIGQGVQYTLSLGLDDPLFPLQVYYIQNRPAGSLSMPYKQRNIRPAGVFSVEKTYDENYIFVPLDFARELVGYENQRTSLEVMTTTDSMEHTAGLLGEQLGPDFNVRTNREQHADLYRLLKMEKLFTFLALTLLIIIASVNIFLSLMMLVIEKQRDISLLASLGTSHRTVKNIFLYEGALVSLSGACVGLLLGAAFCWLQQHVGLVGMGLENGIVSDYPVKMVFSDFAYTFLVVVGITYLVSFYPTRLAVQSISVREL